MSSNTDLSLVTLAASAAAGNGTLTFGFVSSADPGLAPHEYVVVPYGSEVIPFSTRNSSVSDPSFATAYRDCLISDALTVASFQVPDALRPFIAANRAYTYAAGFLGEESSIDPTPKNELDMNTIIANCPHVKEAANFNPQIGTLAVFFCSINYYTSNHNTTGGKLPKGQVKVIQAVLGNLESTSSEVITRCVYLAGHASDKRLTLRSCLQDVLVEKLVRVGTYRPVTIAETDAWAAMRVGGDMAPAGTAVLGLLKVVLTEVAKLGLLGIAPAPEAISDLQVGIETFKRNPEAFHPGARHLFGVDPVTLAGVENLKSHLAVFGGFCLSAGLAISVTSTPHIRKLIDEKKDAYWFSLGKTFARGVDASDEAVRSAMNAMRTTYAASVPNPVENPDGYRNAVTALTETLRSISLNVYPVRGRAETP